ncbi:hypothetical protein AURDEDRAFT_172857 [Auricularia subglabra TFB-10046 SS5]|uniref:DUF6533 domain-containing protein n=1 Tax=Auricularia subglabra (strain TFB-10046 / SS5) TaxID=717982 RepID=J0WWX9_AURST|nr:hypothetical protein AURDEDRAFT_172857 [Auricularia subglabra TFB-10046 SS5]
MSVPDGPDLPLIPEVVENIAKSQLFYVFIVATAALYFYDHSVTLSAEIDLVWRSKWGVGKVLFLTVRYIQWPELLVLLYYGFFNSSPPDCYLLYASTTYSLLVGVTIAHVILVLRTWALWDTSRQILIFLSVLLCAITAADCYLVAVHLRTMTFFSISEVDPRAAQFYDNNFCFGITHNKILSIVWGFVAAFELVIFVMTAIKGVGHFHQRRSSLVSSIYRDSMLCFITIFGISAANVVIGYTNPGYDLVLGP